MANPNEIPIESSVLLIAPAPVYLTSVAKPDKALVNNKAEIIFKRKAFASTNRNTPTISANGGGFLGL